MSNDLHTSQLNRLKRVEGQVRGIHQMIQDDRYCIDILTQIKAIKSALKKVESNIIENHLNHCVHKAVNSSNKQEKQKVLAEIKDLLGVRN